MIFADDVQGTNKSSLQANLGSLMQDSYRKFKNYCTYNQLQPNCKKTHFMQIESSQRRGVHGNIPELCFDG